MEATRRDLVAMAPDATEPFSLSSPESLRCPAAHPRRCSPEIQLKSTPETMLSSTSKVPPVQPTPVSRFSCARSAAQPALQHSPTQELQILPAPEPKQLSDSVQLQQLSVTTALQQNPTLLSCSDLLPRHWTAAAIASLQSS